MPHTISIAIVVATFNSAKTLTQCLNSIITQTYTNKKIIIIDGGSNDDTINIIRRHEEHIAFWLSEPDKGIYDAWNKAIKLMPEDVDWIQFIGSDDYFFSQDVLAEVASTLSKKNFLLAHSRVILKYPSGVEEVVGYPLNKSQFFKTGNMIDATTVQIGFYHHRKLFEKYGLFDTGFKICSDLDFFFRCLKFEESFFLKDIISTVHVLGGISSSAARAYDSFVEKEKIFKKHGYVMRRNKAYFLRKCSCLIKQGLYTYLGDRTTSWLLSNIRKLTHNKPLKTQDPELIEN